MAFPAGEGRASAFAGSKRLCLCIDTGKKTGGIRNKNGTGSRAHTGTRKTHLEMIPVHVPKIVSAGAALRSSTVRDPSIDNYINTRLIVRTNQPLTNMMNDLSPTLTALPFVRNILNVFWMMNPI